MIYSKLSITQVESCLFYEVKAISIALLLILIASSLDFDVSACCSTKARK